MPAATLEPSNFAQELVLTSSSCRWAFALETGTNAKRQEGQVINSRCPLEVQYWGVGVAKRLSSVWWVGR